MANENDLNGKVGLDVTDFKAAVSTLNREIRVIESGFKAVAAGMDDWRTTSAGLESRIDSLNKVTDLQRQKVANLKSEYNKIVESKGKDSKAAQDLEVRINKETASLNKNELELKNNKNALEKLSDESNKAEKEVEQLGNEMEKSAKKSGSLKDALKNLGSHIGSGIASAAKITTGAVIGLGVAAAGAAVGVFKLAEKASDLGEAQNVVASTFKTSAKAIEDWTNTTANSAGISKTASTQWVGFMGAMLKSSGLTEKTAGDMSKSLVQLTGDLSSFYNVATDVMWEKLRAGISGETEPLKALGINMSVANLEAFALASGIKKSYKEMSQAEQTTLRYKYLLSVTKDAQGDFAKTLESSFSNQLRVAKMNIETLGMSIGSIFLPAILNMTKGLNGVFSEINKLMGDGFQNSDLGQIATIVTGLLQKVVSGIATFIPQAIAVIVPALNGMIGQIVQVLPTLLPPLLQGAIALLNGLILLIQQNAQPIANLAVNLITQFINFIAQAAPQLLFAAVDIIIALVNGISGALPQLIPVAVLAILTLVQGLASNLPQIIDMAINLVLSLIDGLISALPLLLQQAPKIIETLINGLVASIPKLVNASIKIITSLVAFIMTNLQPIGKAAGEIIVALVAGLIRAIPQIVIGSLKLIGTIKDQFGSIKWSDIGVNIIKGIASGIAGSVGKIADAAKDAAKTALSAAKNFLGIHSPSSVMRDQVGQFIPAGIALGISDNAKQVDAAMAGLSSKLSGDVSTSLKVKASTSGESSAENNSTLKVMKEMVSALKNYKPVLVIDGREFAYATAPAMDEALANHTDQNNYGLRG